VDLLEGRCCYSFLFPLFAWNLFRTCFCLWSGFLAFAPLCIDSGDLPSSFFSSGRTDGAFSFRSGRDWSGEFQEGSGLARSSPVSFLLVFRGRNDPDTRSLSSRAWKAFSQRVRAAFISKLNGGHAHPLFSASAPPEFLPSWCGISDFFPSKGMFLEESTILAFLFLPVLGGFRVEHGVSFSRMEVKGRPINDPFPLFPASLSRRGCWAGLSRLSSETRTTFFLDFSHSVSLAADRFLFFPPRYPGNFSPSGPGCFLFPFICRRVLPATIGEDAFGSLRPFSITDTRSRTFCFFPLLSPPGLHGPLAVAFFPSPVFDRCFPTIQGSFP